MRCASNIKEVTDTCLNGLVSLLSNKDKAVVAESVVVIKKLLQTQPSAHREIIVQMAKLVDTVTVPQARASILWLLGEYSERVPKIAPDVLRKMAKTFINEEDIVKLQIMTLAVKLCLTNPKQTRLLSQYVLTLARYDQNYDLRDRARFLRHLVIPGEGNTESVSRLSKHAKKLFLASKPAPLPESQFKDRERFQLGSLSHYVNAKALGYQELPTFPMEAPDPKARDVEIVLPWQEKSEKPKKPMAKKRSFYSESEESSYNTSEEDENQEDEDAENGDGQGGSDVSEGDESDTEDSDASETHPKHHTKKRTQADQDSPDESDEEDNDDEDEADGSPESESGTASDTEDESSEAESIGEEQPVLKKQPAKPVAKPQPTKQSNLDLLLQLDDVPPTFTPVMTPSFAGFLSPMTTQQTAPHGLSDIQLVSASWIPQDRTELLNRMSSGGLNVSGRFTRSPHLFSPRMASLELTFVNQGPEELSNITLGNKNLGPGMTIHDFAPIPSLAADATLARILGIDFADSTQPISFQICVGETGSHRIAINAPVGEMIRAVTMPQDRFISEQANLKGMNEHTTILEKQPICSSLNSVGAIIFKTANLGAVHSSDASILRFAGQTLSSQSLVLVQATKEDSGAVKLNVNCEKMVVGSMLLNQLKTAVLK